MVRREFAVSGGKLAITYTFINIHKIYIYIKKSLHKYVDIHMYTHIHMYMHTYIRRPQPTAVERAREEGTRHKEQEQEKISILDSDDLGLMPIWRHTILCTKS